MAGGSGVVLVVSSHVARGSVGNRPIVFALERLGFTVWAVPTVILPHHPGHGPVAPIVPEPGPFATLLEGLARNGRAAEVTGIISGYFGSADQVRAVASIVRTVKAARPDALYLCDPVIGDEGRRYVPEPVATAIRDELLPLADIATPNAFECAWLADAAPDGDLAGVARALPPPTMLVTSVLALMRGQIGNFLVSGTETLLLEHPLASTTANGTGDLIAALFLARRLQGHSEAKAAELAVASVFEVVVGTAKAGADELLFAELQGSIVQPRATVNVRRVGRPPPA